MFTNNDIFSLFVTEISGVNLRYIVFENILLRKTGHVTHNKRYMDAWVMA
jgi:hypothetical protein